MTPKELETLRADCCHIAYLIECGVNGGYDADNIMLELHRAIKRLLESEQRSIFETIQDNLDIYVP